MKSSLFVLISLWVASAGMAASDPSLYRYFSRYDAVIDMGNVSFGQSMPEKGRLHFLIGQAYPALPQRGTLRSGVTTLAHDIDISSDDEYACLTTAEFPPLQQTYFLLDGTTHALVGGDRFNSRVSHSTQGPATSVPPNRCESNLSTGPLALGEAQAHGRSIRVWLSDGAELVITPFYDGLWFDGTIEGDGRTEARLTRLAARGGSTPQRLHWGLHLPGSTSGHFAAGGFVTMQASAVR